MDGGSSVSLAPLLSWLYNLCFPFVLAVLLPGYLWRMVRRGDYRENFGQRFGLFSNKLKHRLAEGPPPLWLQAVSVGEMLIALKLLAALRHNSPGLRIVLSTTTTTGYRLARAKAPADVEVIYTPVDLSSFVRRTFDLLRPTALVIVDGGLWPNQLWTARKHGVPAVLVNARLSPRSERRFRRAGRLGAQMFALLDLVCVPEPGDVARWSSLGVPGEQVRHTGSIKYDDQAAAAQASTDSIEEREPRSDPRSFLTAIGVDASRQILLAGSTHPGEESLLAEAYRSLRSRFPRLFFIIVPRHVERSAEVVTALEASGLKVLRRTGSPSSAVVSPPDVLLVDTTGELAAWYTVATVVFIGKSLLGYGGQNPAEAIMAGKPVVFGPHMENFMDLVRQMKLAGGAIQVADTDGLVPAFSRLLGDEEERARLVAAARQQLAAHHGAAGRTAALLLEALA